MFKKLFSALASFWSALGIALMVMLAIEFVPDLHVAWKQVLRMVDPDGYKPDWRVGAETYQGKDWAKPMWREYFDNSRTDWAPFVIYRTRPAEGEYVNVLDTHRRKTWNPPLAAGVEPVDIWVFGGSTAFGMGSRDDHTIASNIARLTDAAGIPVRVRNYGQPGYEMAREAILLAEELKKGERPDVVIFYDGVNDVFASYAFGEPGLPQNWFNRAREFNLTNRERRWDAVAEGVRAFFRRTTKMAGDLVKEDTPEAPEYTEAERARVSAENATYMQETMNQVRDLADRHGFKALFVLQPTIYQKGGISAFEQHSYRRVWDTAYTTLYGDLLERGVYGQAPDALDLSGIFADRTDGLFADHCHLGEEGDRLIAEAIHGRLGDLGWLRP